MKYLMFFKKFKSTASKSTACIFENVRLFIDSNVNTMDLNRLCIFCLIQMQTVCIQSKKCVRFFVMSVYNFMIP